MLVLRDFFEKELEADTVLTIGAYDGLHLGHQYLLKGLIKRSRELNAWGGQAFEDVSGVTYPCSVGSPSG